MVQGAISEPVSGGDGETTPLAFSGGHVATTLQLAPRLVPVSAPRVTSRLVLMPTSPLVRVHPPRLVPMPQLASHLVSVSPHLVPDSWFLVRVLALHLVPVPALQLMLHLVPVPKF